MGGGSAAWQAAPPSDSYHLPNKATPSDSYETELEEALLAPDTHGLEMELSRELKLNGGEEPLFKSLILLATLLTLCYFCRHAPNKGWG